MPKLDKQLLREITTDSPDKKKNSETLYVRITKEDLQVVFAHPRIRKTSNKGGFYNRPYYIEKELIELFEAHYKNHQKDKIQQFSKEISLINSDPEKDYRDTLELLRNDRGVLNSIYRESASDIIERYVQERIYATALPGYRSTLNDDIMDKIITISTKTERNNGALKETLDTIVADICNEFSFVVNQGHDEFSHKDIKKIPTKVMNAALEELGYSAVFIKRLSKSQKMQALANESNDINKNPSSHTTTDGFHIKARSGRQSRRLYR